MEPTEKRLIDKSIEAFLLAIEIYNKPTIRYRVEGFALFITNAWELMLKARLIKEKGESSIYYKDNTDRTISIENCIRKVFTNDKDPIRLNLEKIVELRNTSTHFITEEYEYIYVPLFQASIFNYENKVMEYHGVDISKYIPENFLTLSASIGTFDLNKIRGKYSSEVSGRMEALSQKIEATSRENGSKFAIRIEVFHMQTKNPNEATEKFRIAKDGEEPVKLIRQLQNPNETHKYSTKDCIEKINASLKKKGINLKYNNSTVELNKFHFVNLVKHFRIKDNPKQCFNYVRTTGSGKEDIRYTYSQNAIDFLIREISKDPENILSIVKHDKKR